MKKITIAVDGFSSSGKSTMAKQLARQIGYIYIDTGAMYRAVTLYAMRNGCFSDGGIDTHRLQQGMKEIHISFKINDETGLPETLLNGENVEREIRNMEVSQRVSEVAALPFVRRVLVEQQQRMGQEKGVVLDGRDVGTVVFPDAELKIFVTASPEIRARRRVDELEAKGMPASFEEVMENVKKRDHIDSTREVGPLRQAEDAVVLDNSEMTREEQLTWLLSHYERAAGK
ncbi:(d)CMP kinase [Parabacteroides sp. OttesenSCG-928-N08]|nr:(d)CMP kinase [Parabacteroides sp. OttesenSCG-928-N08]